MTTKKMTGIKIWQYERIKKSALLVELSVNKLLAEKKEISLSSIVKASKDIDSSGKGLCESTILRNQQCNEIYKKHTVLKRISYKKNSWGNV